MATVVDIHAPAARSAWRGVAGFVAIALVLYALLYAGSEALIYAYGQKNRFFMIRTAPLVAYDYAVLGASHAMPLDFADTNALLEAETAARIINLSVEGAGILPNRLLLDYFFAKHQARTIVYVVDSFAFYSPQWNEQRLADAALLQRAPFDWDAIAALWRYPWARPLLPEYVSGFAKINNRKRFEPDIPDAERNLFTRTYRPVAAIDRPRIRYLYPGDPDPATFARYLAEFRALIRFARDHGAGFVAVKPPLPPRILNLIPKEAEFDAALKALLDAEGVALHDFTRVNNRDAFYYNTDHLNRDGVTAFIKDHLAPALKADR